MRFKFRLEKVLHFARLKETVKKMEVASLQNEILTLEKRKETLDQELRTLLGNSGKSLVSSLAWAPYETSRVQVNLGNRQELETAISTKTEALEFGKLELSRAALKRKALENLREKRKSEFRTEEGRRDQKKLDEYFRLSKQRQDE